MAQRKKVTTVAAPNRLNGVSLAAMIVGILSVVFSWVPLWGSVMGATALALGIVGLAKRAPNRGMALAGTILGAVGLVFSIIAVIIWLIVLIAAPTPAASGTPVPQPYPYFN